MGFFGSLVGWDQSMGALNAVMAYHLLEKSTSYTLVKISEEVINIVRSVRRGQSDQEILTDLNNESPVVQMNFVALACDNLGIQPPIRNNVWSRVKNPYQLEHQVTINHLSAAAESIFKQDGVRVSWVGNGVRVSFKEMLATGTIR